MLSDRLPIDITNLIYEFHPYWKVVFNQVIDEINENIRDSVQQEIYLHMMLIADLIDDLEIQIPNIETILVHSLDNINMCLQLL